MRVRVRKSPASTETSTGVAHWAHGWGGFSSMDREVMAVYPGYDSGYSGP